MRPRPISETLCCTAIRIPPIIKLQNDTRWIQAVHLPCLACVRPRAGVDAHVDVEVVLGGDGGAAHHAHERLLARVHALVRRQRLRTVEPVKRVKVPFRLAGSDRIWQWKR